MKYNKLLLIGIIALVAIISVGSVSAGLFDFLGGDSSNASNSNLTVSNVSFESISLIFL